MFVRLRRFESMTLREVLKGLPVLEFPWLYRDGVLKRDIESFKEAQSCLREFAYWLFDEVLLKLIQTFFFVTDVAEHKRHLFYFRFDVWRVITRPFLRRLTSEMFTPVLSTDVPTGENGASKIRLMPKKNTFRPILSHGTLKEGRTVTRTTLKEVHAVLMSIVARRPDYLGCSILGTDEIAGCLADYKVRMMKRPLNGSYYIVKLDVKSCFDSIPHEALLDLLIHKILPKDDYHIGTYELVKKMNGKTFVAGKRFASPSADFEGLTKLTTRTKQRTRASRILVDRVVGGYLDREALIKALHAHICCNHVQIGKRQYVQRRGIPQGSVLSSVLCSLFYGDMDQRHLSRFLHDPDSLLIRFIDDTLFITTSFELASDFIQSLSPGIPEYGVQVNMAKSTANFFHPLLRCKVPEGQLFPWCGLLLDQQTLEARGDHHRSFGCNIADALTIQRGSKPIEGFTRQLKTFLKPWLTPVCLSLKVNGPQTVAINLYQNFVLAAMKAHCYLKGMATDRLAQVRPDLIVKAISEAADFADSTLQKINPNGKAISVPTHWIAFTAYYQVLRRKPTAYQGVVLEFLEKQSSNPPYCPLDLAAVLRSAEDMLSKIIYK